MCLPVHDEVILDVPAEHIRDAAHALQQVMNDEKLLSVPITASVSVGESWGQKRAYEE
jgi:DNA polymerase-1